MNYIKEITEFFFILSILYTTFVGVSFLIKLIVNYTSGEIKSKFILNKIEKINLLLAITYILTYII